MMVIDAHRDLVVAWLLNIGSHNRIDASRLPSERIRDMVSPVRENPGSEDDGDLPPHRRPDLAPTEAAPHEF